MIREIRLPDYAHASLFLLCVVLAPLALSACDRGATRASGPTLRDSAGIQIVENTAPQWPEGRGWRLAAQPLVEIGVLEGDPNYQLFRVAGAQRLSDGRIVVANSGTSELRFYDASGRFLSKSGRKGGGPGEFDILRWLGILRGDSLVAYDWRNRRVSIFDADGKFARAFTLRTVAQAPPSHVHLALFADGSVLIGAQRLFASGQITAGVYHDTIFYLRFDQQGVLSDTIGRHPGADVYILAHDQGIELVPLPFAASPHSAAYMSGFYFGRGDSYEIGTTRRKASSCARFAASNPTPASQQRTSSTTYTANSPKSRTRMSVARSSTCTPAYPSLRRCPRTAMSWWTRTGTSGSKTTGHQVTTSHAGRCSTLMAHCSARWKHHRDSESTRSAPTSCSAAGQMSSTSIMCGCTGSSNGRMPGRRPGAACTRCDGGQPWYRPGKHDCSPVTFS